MFVKNYTFASNHHFGREFWIPGGRGLIVQAPCPLMLIGPMPEPMGPAEVYSPISKCFCLHFILASFKNDVTL